MSVGLLLITHGELGQCLVSIAEANIGSLGLEYAVLPVIQDVNLDDLLKEARQVAAKLDQGSGVLVITDLFGATPSNLSHQICDKKCQVVHGANLAMLLRAHTYRDLDLDSLAAKLVDGGRRSIFSGNSPDD